MTSSREFYDLAFDFLAAGNPPMFKALMNAGDVRLVQELEDAELDARLELEERVSA